MKTIFITIFLVILTSKITSAQSSLEINIKDCRKEASYTYLAEFKLFKNDTLFKTIKPRQHKQQIIKHLEAGQYRIEYKSMFDKVESVSVDIAEKGDYVVDLCLNYIDYQAETYTPIISRLLDGESYSIEIKSLGCFHDSKEMFLIERSGNSYNIISNGTKTPLSKKGVEAIKHFEIELNYMKRLSCTTVDTYIIKYKDRTRRILDGGCYWNGYYHLKKKLKLD